ncbi:hypothetical protein ABFX02_08G172400 [Erythranthe guttata]
MISAFGFCLHLVIVIIIRCGAAMSVCALEYDPGLLLVSSGVRGKFLIHKIFES